MLPHSQPHSVREGVRSTAARPRLKWLKWLKTLTVVEERLSDEHRTGMAAGLSRAMAGAAKNAEEKHQKDVRDKLIELHTEAFSSAAAYDNAVILAGYVAFFALWAGSAQDVSQLARLVTVSLMGMSLMFYIAWHIMQMLTRQRYEWKLAEAFNFADDPQRFNRMWTETSQKQQIATARLMRFWPWIFVPAVVLGFLAGGILSYNAVAVILHWPQLRG